MTRGRRIGVGVECLKGARGGICRVGLDLFQSLRDFDPDNEYTLVSHRPVEGVDPRCQAGGEYRSGLPEPARVFLWTQFGLPALLAKLRVDAYLHAGSPPFFPYTPRWRRLPKVLLLYDVINVKSPRFFGPLTFLNAYPSKLFSVRAFDRVLTNTEYTRNEAAHILGANPEKFTVVPLALSKNFEEGFSAPEKSVSKEPYILFVGTLEPRKNLQGLLKGFGLSGLAGTHRLVVAGAHGWKTGPILRALSEIGLHDSVTFAGRVTDEELLGLYRDATLLCYPSFDEGFGLPVLEAMAAGCPVVASRIPPLMEVGGDAPCYVDPSSVRDIAKSLIKVVNDKELTRRMATDGRARAKMFSWRSAAMKVKEVLEEVMESRGTL